MLRIGVQTQNVVNDKCPEEGFKMIRDAGFSCVDFSLHTYLKNIDIYQGQLNDFFDKSVSDLEKFFEPQKSAAKKFEITIHQMHMPYPMYVPTGGHELNDYLIENVAQKSMQICKFMDCKYIVVHGLKIAHYLGTEEAEWECTEEFLHTIAPIAKELGITICIENIYNNKGGHIIEGPCCNARKAAERIDRINESYKAEVLGFCFDTGHANLIGLDFEKFLTTLGGRLKVLHIHDNDGIRDLHQIPFAFSRSRENHSSTDWAGFINALKNIHFDKVLNFETGPVLNSFPKELTADTLSFIARIGKYFSGQISD